MEQTGVAKSFKDTLNLPTTGFAIRANHGVDDAKVLEEWQKADLYRKSFDLHSGSKQFLLSDGPPYANGPIHLGHAYNKILKDIVAKSRRMMGFHVPCTPGWDCHGLPIELKVAQENKGLDRIGLQTACRAYAEKWIGVQADGFKKLGVVMNWHQPYKTMDFQYEAKVIRSFADLVDRGYIERKNKTVPWCYSCQTVLATAEIEYAERKDPSIYVLFRADAAVFAQFCSTLPSDAELFLIVWTTTPWTLTLNRAVLMSPTASYVIIQLSERQYGVVGADLVDTLVDLLGIEKKVVAIFGAADFSVEGLLVNSPVVPGLRVPVIKDLSVLVAEGTAFVQNAPGAGPEDYEVGVKNGLEIFCPVGPDGSMLDGINPVFLKGQSIEQVQSWVLNTLHENGLLLFKGSIKHSYPHCWRCRKGLIFRATKQWFCSLTHNGLKEKALGAIGHMLMLPEGSNNRLYATIDARYEWCLSRQRAWGTPIVALLCKQCDYVYCSKAFVDSVAALVEKHGIEVWTQLSAESLVQQGFCCPVCQSHLFEKEQDILDVWFDAGLTHVASISVPGKTHATFDLYLEGKDQHRGYFQSALLTGVALHGESPMRAIITHGFTVDALGKKMSKSLGNGVSPEELVAKIGIDCVRLWAATIDLSGEAVVSEVLLNNISEVYRKIRNTCRFLLSNLYDFSFETDAVSFQELRLIDRYALEMLDLFHKNVMAAYQTYNFTALVHAFADYCTVELSSFYLDIIKDRLYTDQSNGLSRRSAQTVCYLILDTLTRDMAPVLSVLAQQLAVLYQKNEADSIHLQLFKAPFVANNQLSFDKNQWDMLKIMRDAVLKEIESIRQAGQVKHSLEVLLTIAFNSGSELESVVKKLQMNLVKTGQSLEAFLAEFCIVSQVELIDFSSLGDVSWNNDLYVRVSHASGTKCPRCWQWHVVEDQDGLCDRCSQIVHSL